ncbi:MAG: glycosyltransferase [Arcobacter sp.]|nr:glycosyltransferase [Arcobacter sp.]
MNILIVMPNNGIGGAEQFLKMVAEYFKNESVTIVYFKQDFEPKHSLNGNINHQYMTTKSVRLGWLIFVSKLLKNETTYDYVFTSHINVTGTIDILMSLGLLKAKKFIARESTSVFLRFKSIKLFSYKLIYFLGYRNLKLLICQTELMKSQLIDNFPRLLKRTQIEVIPNPIDLNEINRKSQEKITANLPEEYIVTAGRLLKLKGFDLLIKAFSTIKQEYPNLKLIILGDDWDQKDELIKLRDSLNLKEDVIFFGFVENVYIYFKKATLCVVSSRIEGFPNVLLQMMSQNNNVVSTKCAGGIDLIPGLITAETDDEDSLMNGMLKGLSKSKSELNTNRKLYDSFLNDRDIENFINKILKY